MFRTIIVARARFLLAQAHAGEFMARQEKLRGLDWYFLTPAEQERFEIEQADEAMRAHLRDIQARKAVEHGTQ